VNVDLTPDQRAFVQKAIESGRFGREEDAVQEALALWEQRERRRLELLAMLDEADESFARGDGIPITEESVKGLIEDAKRVCVVESRLNAQQRRADGAPALTACKRRHRRDRILRRRRERQPRGG
jgi:putative addiction module CopG family antidote